MFTYRLALPALLATALVAASPVPMDGALNVRPGSRLWVDGTSTVRSFSCEAGSFDAQIQANDQAISAVLGGVKAVQTVDVTVPVKSLDCRNGKMNEHMLKALKAAENPTITYKVSSYELTTIDGAQQATLTGTLTLGGVEKPLVVVTKAKEEAGMLRVTGTQKVTMTEFGIKPPTLMMNTLKVGNDVTVGFDLLLKP